MIIVKVLLLLMLLVPVIFVLGTVASSADVLDPYNAGTSYSTPAKIARLGECLRGATEGLAIKEIWLLRRLTVDMDAAERSHRVEDYGRIKRIAARHI